MKRALLVLLSLGAACSDHERPAVKRDPDRPRRVIDPPSRGVRALPPHAIRADGVGPYRLGATLGELLEQLPSGPRIARFDIPGVVHQDILRAEDDAILIGGEPQGRATYVAVVGGEIARTESGIHVGSTRDELVRTLGAPDDDADHARDWRVIVPSGLPEAHVVLDADRVVALVISKAHEAAHRRDPLDAGVADPGCVRPAAEPRSKRFGACLSGSGEVVVVDGDELSIRAPEGERPIGSPARLPGLVFAAPLRAPDGRDELVAITRADDGQARSWTLVAYRLEGIRLVRTIEPWPLYQLTATSARWIGSELRGLDLYLELTSRPDAIEVGGLLTTRLGDKLRDIAVISPIQVPRRRAKSAPSEPADAGVTDAPGELGSAAGSDRPPRP